MSHSLSIFFRSQFSDMHGNLQAMAVKMFVAATSTMAVPPQPLDQLPVLKELWPATSV